jgi:hypothetical protein
MYVFRAGTRVVVPRLLGMGEEPSGDDAGCWMLGCKQAYWSECTTAAASVMQRMGRVRQRRIACYGDIRLAGAGREKRGRAGALFGGAAAWWRECQPSGVDGRGINGAQLLAWTPAAAMEADEEHERADAGAVELGQAGFHLRLGPSRHRLQQRHGPRSPCHADHQKKPGGHKRDGAQHGNLARAASEPRHSIEQSFSRGPMVPSAVERSPWACTKRRRVEPRRLGFPLTGLRSADAPPIFDRSSRDSRGTLTHPCTQEGSGWRQSPWPGETAPTKSGNCLLAREEERRQQHLEATLATCNGC